MSEPKMNRLSRRAMLRYSATGVAAVGGGLLLGACQTTDPETGQSDDAPGLQQRVDSGQALRLAVANEPPYTVLEKNGELTGAEPDVAQAVLKRMGIDNIKGVQADYDSMIPGLNADRWDMVTAGLFMNKTRCAKVQYSSPVLVSTESFAVPEGNPKGLTTVDDLKNKDVTVAVLEGSFELKTAKSLGIDESKLPTYPLAPDALQGMRDGRVDAILLPTLSLEKLKDQQGGFEITEPLEAFPTTGSGAAFRPGDKEFFNNYNRELEKFKESSEFEQLMNKWGFPAEEARKATTEELCATEG
ncbi:MULTISPECIES: ectoine/hydroxyectoine ABC transporter substrate-binding protein EhuB [Prauserella salsuginis group]|uniref:Polar amino acid transport system substrate-binding protein n=2 Tax=Prauserella salsuginis group TaxID=2893672 RepID=A0A839XRS4_9PSEU|nr:MULTISPECIES: ectoine/hydroxyectoine ABC transporter substrate-binding protein EhuB [Prauserella salsuginis group]MBB3664144.1 polar amino acid transport system substrate-binding protein [Prauserella sediminis]